MKLKIPTLSEASEDYRRAAAQLGTLGRDFAAAEADVDAIEAQITRLASAERKNRILAAAEALVQGRAIDAGPQIGDLRAKLSEARDRVEIIRTARQLQARVLNDLRYSASQVVCDSPGIRAHARALTEKFAAALVGLASVAGEVREFVDGLDAADISWNSRVFVPSIVAGNTSHDAHGEIAYFFANSIEAGELSPASIPKWLRESWSADGRTIFKTPDDLAREKRDRAEASTPVPTRDTSDSGWNAVN